MTASKQIDTPASGEPTNTDAPLPHDRDEGKEKQHGGRQREGNRRPIAQAHDDVERGVQDTERIGVPNDVPSSGTNGG